MEIIVPYSFSGKEYITVYRYHNGIAEKLSESDLKADGNFRLDKTGGRVYIYANKFSTYAIGYTPCYNISGSILYGVYTGSITISLLDSQKNLAAYCDSTPNGGVWSYSFTHIPKGTYYLSATWMEYGKQFSLEKVIEAGNN